jgi:membrane protease YdiL (CAAX protease family)
VVCLLMPALLFTWAGDFDPRRTLGIAPPRPAAWPLVIAMVPFALASSLGWYFLQSQVLPPDLVPKEFNDQMLLLQRRLGEVGFVLAISVTPAICEEFLFRGPVLAGLRRGIGAPGAVVVTAFLFAAMHLSPYRFLPQFALGIVLGAIVVRTGSIWPAVLLHGLHNACAVIPGLEGHVKDLSRYGQIALLACGLSGLWFLARLMPSRDESRPSERQPG